MQPLPIPDLVAILGDIPWALAGGLATRAYMPERVTLDVDIVIHADDEARAQAAFAAAGYRTIEPLGFADPTLGGFGVEGADGPPIDVLTSSAAWVDVALANPGRDAAGLPVLPRPYLMLLKLRAARLRDLDDVQRMLRDTPQAERLATRRLVARHAPTMVEDWDALIQLANLEFGPPPA